MSAMATTDCDDMLRVHEQFMHEALRERVVEQGELALERGEVPVGAVFVYKGEIIARAANRVNELYNATKHAEVVAIEEIAARYGDEAVDVLANTTLYVTCEPCIMCAGALAHVNIQCVYFGCHNDRFGGCSSVLSLHEKSALPDSVVHNGFPCVSGILKEEAIVLLRKFYECDNPRGMITDSLR
ncbi:Trna-specific adenosine deaminase, partial [Globisporangium splendens]